MSDLVYFPSLSDAFGTIFNVLNDVVATKAYSRKLEEEADALGVEASLIFQINGLELMLDV